MSNFIDMQFNLKRGGLSLSLDLSIPKSGITAVFGPSGIGKTTLLRAIAGLDNYPDSLINIGGVVWQDQDHFTPTYERQLAYVFQEENLFDHLTVQSNLEYGLKRSKRGAGAHSLNQIIHMLGIGDFLNRDPATLSGGQRQRVAIARALASNPCLLLMDEPLSSLDMASRQEILPYIENLQKQLEIPIIYVSHSIEEVSRLSDHIVLLESDGLKAQGATQEILTRLDLPLAHYNDAASVIQAELLEHDESYGLSYFSFASSRLSVQQSNLLIGQIARLRIAASDVSLTLEHQVDTSILNIFPATVLEISSDDRSQALVRLNVFDQILLSRVTKKSVKLLDLHVGKNVYAQAKSVALMA